MNEEVDKLLEEAENNGLYGSVEVKFEKGRVVLIKKSETIKPTSYRDNRGRGDGVSPDAPDN